MVSTGHPGAVLFLNCILVKYLASMEESYFRKKTLLNPLLYYFKDIFEDDVNYLLVFSS